MHFSDYFIIKMTPELLICRFLIYNIDQLMKSRLHTYYPNIRNADENNFNLKNCSRFFKLNNLF